MSTTKYVHDQTLSQSAPSTCPSLFTDERVLQFRDICQTFIEGLSSSPKTWSSEEFAAQQTRLEINQPQISQFYLFSILKYCQCLSIEKIDTSAIPFFRFFKTIMTEFAEQEHKVKEYIKWDYSSRNAFVEQLIRSSMRTLTSAAGSVAGLVRSKKAPSLARGSVAGSVAGSVRSKRTPSLAAGSVASLQPHDSISVAPIEKIDKSITDLYRRSRNRA
jgi:hypothetical protein